MPPRAGTFGGPPGKQCRARPVAGVCAWKQFRFDEHHVQKDLSNAASLRKRRKLGETRREPDELDNDVDGKRLLGNTVIRGSAVRKTRDAWSSAPLAWKRPLAVRTKLGAM